MLQRLKGKMGTTPIAYLTRWRMMVVAKRMFDMHASIPRIAASLEYVSEFFFATAFRREMAAPSRRDARDAADVPTI